MGRNSDLTKINWNKIHGFSASEFNGHLDKISSSLVYALGTFRKLLNAPVYISPATWGAHSPASYHSALAGRNKLTWAIDIFPSGSLVFAYNVALRIKEFGGVGVYPFWGWKDKLLMGGLHLDIRHYKQEKLTWWYNSAAGNGNYNYLKTQEDVLDMYSVIHSIGVQT